MRNVSNRITWIIFCFLLLLMIFIGLHLVSSTGGTGSGGTHYKPHYCCYTHPSQPEEPHEGLPAAHPIP